MEHSTTYKMAIAAIRNAGLYYYSDPTSDGESLKLRSLMGATIPDCDAPTQLFQTLRLLAHHVRTFNYTYCDRAGNTNRLPMACTRFYF